MRYNEILPAQAAAGNSEPVIVGEGRLASFMMAGTVAAGELATLETSHNGTDWVSVYDETALVQIIGESQTIVTVKGPGRYRIAKGVTAAAVSIQVAVEY